MKNDDNQWQTMTMVRESQLWKKVEWQWTPRRICATCRRSPRSPPTARWSPRRGREQRWNYFSHFPLDFWKIWSQVQSFLLAAVSPFLASLLSQASTGLIIYHHLLYFFCWYSLLNLFLSFSFFRKHFHLNPFLSRQPSRIPLHLPGPWEAFQRRRVFFGTSPRCLSAID